MHQYTHTHAGRGPPAGQWHPYPARRVIIEYIRAAGKCVYPVIAKIRTHE